VLGLGFEAFAQDDSGRTMQRERFKTLDGFTVEEVTSAESTGSLINMTFDHLGRPVVSREGGGLVILIDENGDGLFEGEKIFSDDISSAQGIHFVGPGDVLVQANGEDGAGMYRATDTDGDDVADEVVLVRKSRGEMGEHGPHAILSGPDGYLYTMYGNHSHPDSGVDDASPLANLQEDGLLPRIVDPRGHATDIRPPGGTIHRFSLETGEWHRIVGGFRNAFDLDIDVNGEMFVYDSDMEWDTGLPWFRPTRVIHSVPGADHGWRTGSNKWPDYYLDSLPGTDDVGRGSPVGVRIYDAYAYPSAFRYSIFLGDWSRGRIRVFTGRAVGASYEGTTEDFVVGEPLNITDLDVGPDGFLYFTTGGRNTRGGLYRVRYDGPLPVSKDRKGIDAVLHQPMPRSAWGTQALLDAKEEMGSRWKRKLRAAVKDKKMATPLRLRALEALQLHGPQPDVKMLRKAVHDSNETIRGAAAALLAIHDRDAALPILLDLLNDDDALPLRRACEALVRVGIEEDLDGETAQRLAKSLHQLLGHEDRFVRYSARQAIIRLPRDSWEADVLADDMGAEPRRSLEGLVALVHTQETEDQAHDVFDQLRAFSQKPMTSETLLDYLRVVQLAYVRDTADHSRGDFAEQVGPRLLEKFPSRNPRINRELANVLAHLQTPGTIEALLTYLDLGLPQEEQIYTAFALRTIEEGWTSGTRHQFVNWFNEGWAIRGGASVEGYINDIWEAALSNFPEHDRRMAEERKEAFVAEQQRQALALLAEVNGEGHVNSDLLQMSLQELSEYLEYDPMAYRRPDLERGERVFVRLKCANCHIFGSIGRGGGPDLSTVVSRFSRPDLLEAIMYPSRIVSDQYTAVSLELRDFRSVTGMVAGENDASLTVITIDGDRVDIAKEDIIRQQPAQQSLMPEGLLGAMTLGDLVALVNFMERGADEDQ
jgi:putative heme-binding domain-containing protein